MNGLPILLNRPMLIVVMYLEPHGSMDEHSASVPVLFLVTRGKGFVRIGGPNGETRSVTAGDAVLWPANLDHKVGPKMKASTPLSLTGHQSGSNNRVISLAVAQAIHANLHVYVCALNQPGAFG